jgi:hypothetical protein
MKSTIDNTNPLPITSCPKLMYYQDAPELVILIRCLGTAYAEGMVVHASAGKLNEIGEYSIMWTTERLVDFHGSVTLSN